MQHNAGIAKNLATSPANVEVVNQPVSDVVRRATEKRIIDVVLDRYAVQTVVGTTLPPIGGA